MARRRQDTKARQTQIIDAAQKVIAKYGSEHLTVKRIAKEVGISEAAIYRHFKSKRDILSFLVKHIEASLLEDIAQGTASSQAPLESLDSVLRNHFSAIQQRRGISFQVIAEIISLGDRKLNTRVADVINNYTSRLKNILSQGVKAGELREDIDLEAAALVLFGTMQGLVNMWALSNYSFDLEKKYLPLWDTFRQAIIKR